jgi:hypothetical protein
MQRKLGTGRRFAARVAMAAGAVIVGTVLSAQPAQAKTVLGPVDLNVYCSSIGYAGARLTAYNAYGWLCYDAGRTTGIHVEKACAGQYNNPALKADFYSLDDPFSWYCYI